MPRKGQKLFPWYANDYQWERQLETMRRERLSYRVCAEILTERSGIPVTQMMCIQKMREIKARDPQNDPSVKIKILADRVALREERIGQLEAQLLDNGIEPEGMVY